MTEVGDMEELAAFEERLNGLADVIGSWNWDESTRLGCHSEDILKFVEMVTQVLQLLRDLQAFQSRDREQNDNGPLGRGHIVLQNSMRKLQEKLMTLLHDGQPPEPIFVSFRSENNFPVDLSVTSFRSEYVQEMRNESRNSEEFLIDLIDPIVLPDIKHIVRVMFNSGYEMECRQSYIAVRKDALEMWLSTVGVENLSIEEVVYMEWESLYKKIGRWIKVIKNFIRKYLVSEKHLCDLIFGDLSNSASRACFRESSNDSMMQLLSFAEAVALGTPAVEKLFKVLDVYETLLDLLPDIELLNLEYFGSCMMTECQEIMSRLAQRGRGIFLMFKGEMLREPSDPCPSDGVVYRRTRYVMNYITHVAEYENGISSIFACSDSGNISTLFGTMDINGSCNHTFSLGQHLISIMSDFEFTLEKKSSSYQNPSLRHLFMMNNVNYMVRKVKEHEYLQHLIGDDWIKSHMVKYRNCATLYIRMSWYPIISIITEEGSSSPKPSGTKKFKEKLKNFNRAFEELYKVQTAWKVQDEDLRNDLLTFITQGLIPAYRQFLANSKLDDVGIFGNQEKFTTYSVEDIQNNYLWDLFQGSPKSLPGRLVWKG